jgi:phosphate uptake regulator
LDENYSKEIIDQEEKIKTLHDETVNILKVNMKESAENIDLGCFLIDVSKNLIFMANQIRTIAQELVFLFEAKIVKHQQNMNKESKPEDLINDDMV